MKHILYLLVILGILVGASLNFNRNVLVEDNITRAVDLIKISPPNLQVYHSVNKYAPQYDIPLKYAFRTAYEETTYMGPNHTTYNPAQTSFAYAEGPFQFLLSTARYIAKDKSLTREEIRHNVELNTELSMKYQRYLKNKLKRWDLVYGYYNTGYPQVNSYAKNIVY